MAARSGFASASQHFTLLYSLTAECSKRLPPQWIPDPVIWENYLRIWTAGPLLTGIQNSLIVACSVTIIGTRYGLPASARPLVEARPANAAPQYMPDATISIERLKL